MEDDPIYQLIHAVDPTKIKVPIREKFAKLTLSSTKKKKAQLHDEGEQQQDNCLAEKRQSASRNLIAELTASQIQTQSTKSTESIDFSHTNPIFRTDSSSSCNACAEDTTVLNTESTDENAAYIDETEFMDKLEVTADLTHVENYLEEELNALVQKVSTLDVVGGVQSLNSTEDLQELTQLVSTESQRRVSSGRLSMNFLQERPIKTEVQPEVSICISSTLDDEDDQEDDAPITISDTASSAPDEPTFDYDVATSNIPATGETVDIILPDTFSNDKADRLEAFLRDVSFERHEMEKNGFCNLSQSELPAPAHDRANEKVTSLASADTESMSADPNITLDEDSIQKALQERQNRLLALDDTVAMSLTQASVFERETQHHHAMQHRDQPAKVEHSHRCMAHDDTEANTLMTDDLSGISGELNKSARPSNGSSSALGTSFKSAIPDESLLIPETSKEIEPDPEPVTNPDRVEGAGRVSTPTSNDIVQSEPALSAEHTPLESQTSQMQLGMASINISAKFNIKIQISHQEVSGSSSGDEEDASSSKESTESERDAEVRQSIPLTSNSGSSEPAKQCEQRMQTKENHLLRRIPSTELAAKDDSDDSVHEEEAKQFLTHAQTLLNQLYGKAWQTPDVIKTLKRSSKSAGKSGERKSKLTPKETQTPKQQQRPPVEESMLDDFSIFRRNIVKTNMDSTRLATTPHIANGKRQVAAVRTAPRPKTIKSSIQTPTQCIQPKDKQKHDFKVPQTEMKPRRIVRTAATTQSARSVKNQRWRQLIDPESDTEEVNASDDDDIDCTGVASDSDKSWTKSDLNQTSDSDDDEAVKTQAKSRNINRTTRNRTKKGKNDIVYLDLTNFEVSVAEGTPPSSPPANHDENFNSRLADILRTCRPAEKPKLLATPSSTSAKPKRKLFTQNFGEEDDLPEVARTPPTKNIVNKLIANNVELIEDLEDIPFDGLNLRLVNKHLDAIKTGKPIFPLTPPRAQNSPSKGTPKTVAKTKGTPATGNNLKTPVSKTKPLALSNFCDTPNFKYGFLKSLDVSVSKAFCHPDALVYRDQYNKKKTELAKLLYDLYNERIFNNALDVPLIWHKKLSTTAGRCLNKKKLGTRSSVIELSDKVLTSADRLRCTLIHELCHAATWVFNGEGGHGPTWKNWARRATEVFPELPKIGVCHQYDIEYKYTYKCTLCAAKSQAHSKSKKVENIRCSYCHGAIEIFLNKKDKDGNIVLQPIKEPTGFAKFVKDNYKKYKKPDLKHADVMKLLSNEFAAIKVNG